jgi:hypothetical protein
MLCPSLSMLWHTGYSSVSLYPCYGIQDTALSLSIHVTAYRIQLCLSLSMLRHIGYRSVSLYPCYGIQDTALSLSIHVTAYSSVSLYQCYSIQLCLSLSMLQHTALSLSIHVTAYSSVSLYPCHTPLSVPPCCLKRSAHKMGPSRRHVPSTDLEASVECKVINIPL